MIHDPHKEYNPNFYEEDFEEFLRNDQTLSLMEQVKSIIDQGLVAKIDNELLSEVSFNVRSRVDYAAPVLQLSWDSWYTALAICRMVHGCYEKFEKENVTKFYKSEVDNVPMYPPNIIFDFSDIRRKHGKAVLKPKYYDETQNTRPARMRQNFTTTSTSSKRDRDRDTPEQYSLFDIHTSS